MVLNQDFRKLIQLSNEHEVQSLVVMGKERECIIISRIWSIWGKGITINFNSLKQIFRPLSINDYERVLRFSNS